MVIKNFDSIKGQSLELLSKYSHEFQSCFIVSDFDDSAFSKDLIREKLYTLQIGVSKHNFQIHIKFII